MYMLVATYAIRKDFSRIRQDDPEKDVFAPSLMASGRQANNG
jgi:hypothetical protein